MSRKIQNWAFIAPRMSRDLSEYFAGILDCVKHRPEIFLHSFTYTQADLSQITEMDGIISYTQPDAAFWELFRKAGRPRPPTVVITTCRPKNRSLAYAHIDADGVAGRVFNLLKRRHCRSYAFCSNHTEHFLGESAALLRAYRRVVFAETGTMPRLFRPISTCDPNLIQNEVERFHEWTRKQIKPCGIFVHSDDVARKLLDTCRLKGIRVPGDFRVIGTGDSAVFCERTYPTLSSYAVDHEKTGYSAAVALQHMLEDGWSARRASFEVPLTEVSERASTIDEHGSARLAQEARTFIRAELDRGVAPTIRDVAYHLNVSRRKLEQDFAEIYGRTIHDEIANAPIGNRMSLVHLIVEERLTPDAGIDAGDKRVHQRRVVNIDLLGLGQVVQLEPLRVHQGKETCAHERLEHLETLIAPRVEFTVERAHHGRLRTALSQHHQHLARLADRILRDILKRGIVHLQHLVHRIHQALLELSETLAIERIVSLFLIGLEMRQHFQLRIHLTRKLNVILQDLLKRQNASLVDTLQFQILTETQSLQLVLGLPARQVARGILELKHRRPAVNDVQLAKLVGYVLDDEGPVFAKMMHLVQKQMRIPVFVEPSREIAHAVACKPQIVQRRIHRLVG